MIDSGRPFWINSFVMVLGDGFMFMVIAGCKWYSVSGCVWNKKVNYITFNSIFQAEPNLCPLPGNRSSSYFSTIGGGT